jgi:protoporphyrinogen/coproporphyrinogen III oxidase
MCYQLAEGALVTLWKQCHLSPRCQASFTRRRFRLLDNTRTFGSSVTYTRRLTKAPKQRLEHTTSSETQEQGNSSLSTDSLDFSTTRIPPQNIAILGGGITGLASAYYLSKEAPSANITLYESTERLGGWLNSKHINVGQGTVVFEQGPRTIRPTTPAGRVTVDLVRTLKAILVLIAHTACRLKNLASKTKSSLPTRAPLQHGIDLYTTLII